MKKILMIGTGGTIASLSTADGLKPELTPKDVLSYIPMISEVCEVETRHICSLDSTNIRAEHWQLMVKTIEESYDDYDGFVVCHGTDTLAYTAAALSYMIQNSPKPIVVTGAQKPINMDSTDGRVNLSDSFIYASDDDAWGVSIVFDGKVIAGTRAKKEFTKSYNAFSSINYPYRAILRDGRVIHYINTPGPERSSLRFSYEMNESIAVLKLIPGTSPELLEYYFEHYRCIIIEMFGVGGIPDYLMETFRRRAQQSRSSGQLIVMATQVVHEGSDMGVYEVGKKIKEEFNLIEAYDMTIEAVVTKLMWILGQSEGLTTEEMRKLFYTSVNNDLLLTPV